jgi:serine/threonine-protein kinase
MATVTLAEDLLLLRRVALKRVHTAGDLRELRRLRREALVGASLNHRNLVAVYDAHEAEDGDLMIVMEYVEGETLRQAIRRRGAFPADQALPVLRGVADALDALHGRGIVHRDVKPENILLGSQTVKLADLGLARAAEHTQTTAGGPIAGTFSYMAPEQLEGRETGPAIDVYALAAVAFEMLSGSKARRESNPVALAHAIATRPPPDLREAWPQAPPEAAALLTTAMSPDPATRPSSAGALVARLGDSLSPRARPTPPAPPAPRRPRPSAAPLAAAHGVQRPSRSPRVAAQSNGPVRGTPAARPWSSRAGERKGGTPAASPAAALVPVRRRSSRRRTRVAAVLALLLAVGLLAALVGTSGSGRPSHARSTSGTKGASAKKASERGRSSPPSTRRTPSQPGGAGREAAPPTRSSPTAGASEGAAPAREAAPPAAAAAPASRAGSPATAVQSFYEAAARHDYPAAWQLADGNMRAELAGFESFRAQQSAVRSITFHRAEVISGGGAAATVAVATTAVLADRTEQCSGTVRLLRSPPASWLLDGISINCVP